MNGVSEENKNGVTYVENHTHFRHNPDSHRVGVPGGSLLGFAPAPHIPAHLRGHPIWGDLHPKV